MPERFVPNNEFVPGNEGYRAPRSVDFSQYRLTREPQIPYAGRTPMDTNSPENQPPQEGTPIYGPREDIISRVGPQPREIQPQGIDVTNPFTINPERIEYKPLQRFMLSLNQKRVEKEAANEEWTMQELRDAYKRLSGEASDIQQLRLGNADNAHAITSYRQWIVLKLSQNLDGDQLGIFLSEAEQEVDNEKKRARLDVQIRKEKGYDATHEVTDEEREEKQKQLEGAFELEFEINLSDDQKDKLKIERTKNTLSNLIRGQIQWPKGKPLPADVQLEISKAAEATVKQTSKPEFIREGLDRLIQSKIDQGEFTLSDGRERLRWLPESIQEFADEWMKALPEQFRRDGEYALLKRVNDEQGEGEEIFQPQNFVHAFIHEMLRLHDDAGDANPVNFWQKLNVSFGGSQIPFEYMIDNVGLFFKDAKSGKDLFELMETVKGIVWQLNWARQTWQAIDFTKGTAEKVMQVLEQQFAQNALTKYFKQVITLPGFTQDQDIPLSNFYKGGEGFGKDNTEVGSGVRAALAAYRFLDDSHMLKRIFGSYDMVGGENEQKQRVFNEDSWKDSALFNNKTFIHNYINANSKTAEFNKELKEKYQERFIKVNPIGGQPHAIEGYKPGMEGYDFKSEKPIDQKLFDEVKKEIQLSLEHQAREVILGEANYSKFIKTNINLQQENRRTELRQNGLAEDAIKKVLEKEADQYETQAKEALVAEYGFGDGEDGYFNKETGALIEGKLDAYMNNKLNYYRSPKKSGEQIKYTDSRIRYSLAHGKETNSFQSIDLKAAQFAQIYANFLSLPLSFGVQDTNFRAYNKAQEGSNWLFWRANQAASSKGQFMGFTSAAIRRYYWDAFYGILDLNDNSMMDVILGGEGDYIDFMAPLEGNDGKFENEAMSDFYSNQVARGNRLKEGVLEGEEYDITGIVKLVPDPRNPLAYKLEVDEHKLNKHRKQWNDMRYLYGAFDDLDYTEIVRDREYEDPESLDDVKKKKIRYVNTSMAEAMLGYSVLNQEEFRMNVARDNEEYENTLRARYRLDAEKGLSDEQKEEQKEEIESKVNKRLQDAPRYHNRLIIRDDADRKKFGTPTQDLERPGEGKFKIDPALVQKGKDELWKWVIMREYAEMLHQHRKRGSLSAYRDGRTVETFIKLLEVQEGDPYYNKDTDRWEHGAKVFEKKHIDYLRKMGDVSVWRTEGTTIGKHVGVEALGAAGKGLRVFAKSITS